LHNFVRLFISVLIISILLGCSPKIKIKTIDKSYETPTAAANIRIPQIQGLNSLDLQSSINEDFVDTTAELLNKFQAQEKQTGEKSEFSMNTAEHYNKNGFFSIVTDYCYYARSANKTAYRITKNINTKNCIEIPLSELFESDSYIDVLNSMLENIIHASPDIYQGLWKKPKITQNQAFYIDAKNLVLYYPPYELSYYERGYVEIPIPLVDILTYLKPEYREIFAN